MQMAGAKTFDKVRHARQNDGNPKKTVLWRVFAAHWALITCLLDPSLLGICESFL